ncbi:MAG: ATP-binding protein [bacterium]
MNEVALYPRMAEGPLLEALADTPVVLIHGPRQCGKTTLARMVGEARGFTYFSFDDDISLAAARSDPIGFLADMPEHVILDEVQRVPQIFSSLKLQVDRHRTPGRYILTGSANVLLVPQLADSLAGRMEIHQLHPLAQCELARQKPWFLATLFDGLFQNRRYERQGIELADRIVSGGYPAAIARATPRRRMSWYRNTIETLVQRDIRDLARIRGLNILPRLLTLAAGQTAQLFNVSDLAGPFQVSRPTIHEYLTLLERLFLLEQLPPWHHNRLSRLIKTPKLHIGDTGIACALLGLDVTALRRDRLQLGRLLETFVFQELRRQSSACLEGIAFYHFRDKDGTEVDLVLERGTHQIAGIEVKAASTVTPSDFRGLIKLRESAGQHFVAGVVLYDGETSASFSDRLFAIPLRALWEPP